MRRPHSPARAAAAAVALVALAAGCSAADQPDEASGSRPGGERPVVVTDMYPTTFAVQQVAGDAVDIIQLAPAGVEPHDYELTPKQVQQVAEADLVAYLPGMIPAVEQAVAQEAADRAVDVTAGIALLEGHSEEAGTEEAGTEEEHADEAGDPHVWLDPANMAAMGANAARALAGLGVDADAAALQAEMTTLDEESRAQLGTCAIPTMVVSHEAFAYLAQAYGFTQVGIAGLTPEAEPSPAKMAQIIDLVQAEGITTIYFESLVSPAAAEAIAAETGTTTALLDPIEGNTDESGYVALMRANIAALQAGQSCT